MKILSCFLGIIVFFLVSHTVQANYVLPYPSYMPGHKLYIVSRVLDKIKAYWYWGNIGQFKYHLGISDKYLVEAKTLFDYGQYLLAVDALNRSTKHAKLLEPVTSQQKELLFEAMKVHYLILEELKLILPDEFTWQPEKEPPTYLPLESILEEAHVERKRIQTLHEK